MNVEIVFSDVDGTLLNNEHKMLEGTMYAIRKLQAKDIPFVIISARSPSGIYPILEENGTPTRLFQEPRPPRGTT